MSKQQLNNIINGQVENLLIEELLLELVDSLAKMG